MRIALPRIAGIVALAMLGTAAPIAVTQAESALCMDCLRVRVGPPTVVRGPFPDELDATFTALKLADGSFRGFSANGATYAIEGISLWDMGGERRAVMQPGEPDKENECGRWLTSTTRMGGAVLGFVHQESICDYGPQGQTDKTMAIASSADDGLTWTDLGTVLSGPDAPRKGTISGEGDCALVDGMDAFLYAYCLRNSDWQTIVARAPASDPTDWHKFNDGTWNEPGLDGAATAIGFFGPAAAYLQDLAQVATVTTDPWFGGVRLSLSADKVSFVDLDEPLLTIDGSDWNRPAASDLVAYATMLNPYNGSNIVNQHFLLSYVYVPPGKGFESRYLVQQEVSLSLEDEPLSAQVGMALARWSDPARKIYVTSTGPLTGDRQAYQQDTVVAHMLTRPPEGVASIKFAECSSNAPGHLDQVLVEDGYCSAGYVRERSAGWLYAAEQKGSVPVYRCHAGAEQTHFASSAADCEGLGDMDFLLGYGLAP